MGKLTRRVKFIARERRLSIPAEFLHRHSVQRGDQLWVAVRGQELYVFHPDAWKNLRDLSSSVVRWYSDEHHPFFKMLEFGITVKLGSQDRIVLPRDFPFHSEETLRMHWELQDGFLRMTPEETAPHLRSTTSTRVSQTSMSDFFGSSSGRSFDREMATRKLVERIPVRRIDHRDLCCSTQSPIPSEALLRSIRIEGIRHPLLLRKLPGGTFQIIHGYRRVAAARRLKMSAVPCIVFESISDDDRDRLKLVASDDQPMSEGTPLRRLQSTVKLYQGQVELSEIEKITGRRKRTLQRYLRVAENKVLREAIEKGRLSIFKAEEILKAGIDPEMAIRRKMTVKEIRAAARKSAQGRRRPRRRTHRSSPQI